MAKHEDKSQYDGSRKPDTVDPSKIQKPKDDDGRHSGKGGNKK
jgi:hypothetical protein